MAPIVSPPCTTADARSSAGGAPRGDTLSSRPCRRAELGSRLTGAPPDQGRPRVPQPGLSRVWGRFSLRACRASSAGARCARAAGRRRASRRGGCPSSSSRPPATKSHASATGSRSAWMTPRRWPSRITSAKKSCTSRTCLRSAAAITASSEASASDWIQRSTMRMRERFAMYASAIAPRHRSGSSAIAFSRSLAEAAPRLVEAREVEVALRAEVAVEDRLADARLARDLRGRRPAVARAGEERARRVEHGLPPRLRRQALLRLHRHGRAGHAPSAATVAERAGGARPCGSQRRRRSPRRGRAARRRGARRGSRSGTSCSTRRSSP